MPNPVPLVALQHLDVFAELNMIRSLLPYIKDAHRFRSLTLKDHDGCDLRSINSEVAQALLPIASRLHRFSAPDRFELSPAFDQLLSSMTNPRELQLAYAATQIFPRGPTTHSSLSVASLHNLTSLQELEIRRVWHSGDTDQVATALIEILNMHPPSLK